MYCRKYGAPTAEWSNLLDGRADRWQHPLGCRCVAWSCSGNSAKYQSLPPAGLFGNFLRLLNLPRGILVDRVQWSKILKYGITFQYFPTAFCPSPKICNKSPLEDMLHRNMVETLRFPPGYGPWTSYSTTRSMGRVLSTLRYTPTVGECHCHLETRYRQDGQVFVPGHLCYRCARRKAGPGRRRCPGRQQTLTLPSRHCCWLPVVGQNACRQGSRTRPSLSSEAEAEATSTSRSLSKSAATMESTDPADW